uniref:Uncharacterized protein n=1 Tax=Arundo donax TaxID=35708 RepID=A0A0A9GM64_ARUDO
MPCRPVLKAVIGWDHEDSPCINRPECITDQLFVPSARSWVHQISNPCEKRIPPWCYRSARRPFWQPWIIPNIDFGPIAHSPDYAFSQQLNTPQNAAPSVRYAILRYTLQYVTVWEIFCL